MSSNTLFQFAGAKAVGADTSKLSQAIDMNEAGKDESAILKETGWFKGVDRQWRFEISDREVHFDEVELKKLSNGELGLSAPLSQVFKHEALFQAYPHLRGVKFIIRDAQDRRIGGWWSDATNTVCLHRHMLVDLEKCLDIMVHELQHSIQSYEGFALGGNDSDSFYKFLEQRLQSHLSASKISLNRWLDEHSDAVDNAEKAHEKALYGRLFNSYKKVMNYAQHESPTRVKRHLENQCHWLYNEMFRENGTLSREVSDVQVEWYNMPKNNNHNQKSEFLSSYAYDVAQLYLNRIPEEYRKEFMLVDGKFEPTMEKLNKISKEHSLRVVDRIPIEEDLSAMKNSFENFNQVMTQITPTSRSTPYNRLAGEVEANNVINRRKMPDAVRARSIFSGTQSEDSNKQIVYFDPKAYTSNTMRYSMTESQPKGSVTFKGESFAKVLLAQNSDLSTIVHEGSHIFLEAYSDLAKAQPDNADLQKEFGAIMEWFDVSKEEWFEMDIDSRRDLHEEFAEAFESYVAGGRNHPLAKIFDDFKSWIKDIYGSLSGVPETKPLTKNIDKLFSDMVSGVKDNGEDPFVKSLSTSIEESSGMDKAQAIAGSLVIDSTFSHLSKVGNLERKEFNSLYNIEVAGSKVEQKNKLKLG